MSYMNKINQCNKYNESNKNPFLLEGIRVGQIFKKNEAYCLESGIFVRDDKGLTLKDEYKTFDTRTEILREFAKNALSDGVVDSYMSENYPILASVSSEPLAFVGVKNSNEKNLLFELEDFWGGLLL